MVLYAWCVGKDVLLFVRHLSMVIDFVFLSNSLGCQQMYIFLATFCIFSNKHEFKVFFLNCSLI